MLTCNGITNIIFDFDGVIADTNKSRYQILADLLKERDINSSESFTIDYLKGESSKAALRNCFPEISNSIIEDIVSKRHDRFLSNLNKYCLEIDGATSTIDKLKNFGFNLTLATSNTYEIAIQMLDYLGIRNCFTTILGNKAMLNGSGKKDYSKIMDLINEKRNNRNKFIVIEDSYNGVLAAKNAGFKCIAFDSFYEPTNDLADFSVKNYSELRNYFKIQ